MLAGLLRAAQQGTVGRSPAPGGSARQLWAGPERTLPGTVISGLLAQARAAELARRTLGSGGGAVLAPPSSHPGGRDCSTSQFTPRELGTHRRGGGRRSAWQGRGAGRGGLELTYFSPEELLHRLVK